MKRSPKEKDVLKSLEGETAKLKKLLTAQMLDLTALKELVSNKW